MNSSTADRSAKPRDFAKTTPKSGDFGVQRLIELRSAVKVYESLAGSVTALDGIDLQIFPGEFLVVTGKSGSGKTTLVNILTGLDRATSGEIWVNGEPMHDYGPERAAKVRGKSMGVVFQSFELLPTLTVLQNVMLPMDFSRRFPIWEQRKRATSWKRSRSPITQKNFRLPYPADSNSGLRSHAPWRTTPRSLSQTSRPAVLISATAEIIMDIFDRFIESGRTVFMVTHDRDIARRGSRIVTLSDGKIVGVEETAHA